MLLEDEGWFAWWSEGKVDIFDFDSNDNNTSCTGSLGRRAREARSGRGDERGTPRIVGSVAGGVRERGVGVGFLQGRTNGELAVFSRERAPGAQDSQGVVFLQQDEELSDDVRRIEGGCEGRGGSNKQTMN